MDHNADRREHQRAYSDDRRNEACWPRSAWVEGLRSGIAKKPFQTARHLAADGVLSEHEAGHSDRDDDQRPKGEHRIISKRRAEARVLMANPLRACLPD